MNTAMLTLIDAAKEKILAQKEWLTSLDAAIGDGDHGINMARGFEAVATKVRTLPPEAELPAILKTVGMTLISTVGGASGPLYGTAFLRAADQASKSAGLPAAALLGNILAGALQGIKDRGKATTGEKTMVDALEPACVAYDRGLTEGKPLPVCLEMACEAARQGVEYTKTIIATKGRASYLGERSLGHQDPGATSLCLLLEILSDFVNRQEVK
ncbi:dihydroxyacetone kinase subunit DhaL [Propionispora hippei]|uniref:phosphoenolpyruvate--glycerone phosphotransferase n=1 Tax=Propionispora hippei DSM 15287 TaxID=1123003 RepID=A0A1M6FNP6_9FIRM|nr:dihydroxyacetone kinase subunit DhaL [Propionispora hippei]SHI99307.1 dihydroxyacetone kinase, C-terminal domain [Propionispora hippei DSM 15287]